MNTKMSASVFNFKPIRHEITRLRTPPPLERCYSNKDVQRVRRVLFGPVDHDENLRFVEIELARQIANQSKHWEFDFLNDVPLDADSDGGKYHWSIMTPTRDSCKRPTKKDARDEMEDEEECQLYFHVPEDLGMPRDGVEKMATSPIASLPNKSTCKRQSVITGMFDVSFCSFWFIFVNFSYYLPIIIYVVHFSNMQDV